jgi:hypothetical protein
MRLTSRCVGLLRLLRAARWLTTTQIQRRFFPLATADAVRKRLRKLTSAKYLVAVRRDRMSQAIFTIGPEGKRILEKIGGEVVSVDRKPPIQREHSLAINDLRIAAELAGTLKFFYAAHELPALGWSEAIIPDALLAFDNNNVALEFDTGAEGVTYFVRTKMSVYRRGFSGIPIHTLVVVADRTVRMFTLAKAIGDVYGRVVFTTLDMIQGHPLLSPIFYTEARGWGVSLFENLSSQTLSSSRDFSMRKGLDIKDLGILEQGLLRQEGVVHAKDSD